MTVTPPLAEVIALSEKATGGSRWEPDLGCIGDSGGRYNAIMSCDPWTEVVGESGLSDDDAAFIAALVNWFRASAPSLRDEARDAARWREVADKAWFVDAAGYVYGLREGCFAPTCDPDDVIAAIDAAIHPIASEGEA